MFISISLVRYLFNLEIRISIILLFLNLIKLFTFLYKLKLLEVNLVK